MLSISSLTDVDTIREYTVETSRIVQNLREIGKGPLAIFLHGISAVGAVWDPVMMRVKGSLRAVAVDQRGHGYSGKPGAGYSADDFSQDLLALIESLDCGPAIVVGHSLGARNAVVAAVSRPDLVRAVVAVDFTPYIETEVFEALESRVNGGDRPFASVADIEAYLHRVAKAGGAGSARTWPLILEFPEHRIGAGSNVRSWFKGSREEESMGDSKRGIILFIVGCSWPACSQGDVRSWACSATWTAPTSTISWPGPGSRKAARR